MNRRQQLLRTAGCVSVAAYQHSRASESAALPTLFIIVDEFTELLSQHPEFADTFVAIGRALVRCHVVADSSLPERRATGTHNDWTITTGSPHYAHDQIDQARAELNVVSK